MRPGLKKALKVSLISIGSLLGLCIVAVAVVLWFVLTPSKLTPMVEKAANTYLNADVKVGNVDVAFFSTFPRFTIKIDDGELVSHVAGADSLRSSRPYRDSLLQFAHCRVSLNPLPLITDNRIVIGRVLLDSAKVYAWRDR